MRPATIISIFLMMFFTARAVAGAKITGSTRFQFAAANTSVTFGCQGISNPSRENATGNLILRLWALESTYQGGGISGKILGSYKLDGLNPGATYSNLSRTVKTTLPTSRRSYALCLTLLEYQGNDYVITDYRNFSDSVVLGPQDLFSMKGPWRWQTSTEGGTVEMEVASISHTRASQTGSLKLALWATKQPYNGGNIQGFQLGTVPKAALKQGYTYNNLKNTAKYMRPPAGTYYMNLVLTEFDEGEYRIVDYLPQSSTSTFK